MLRYLVLGFLRDGSVQHGYALTKKYRERSGNRISTGNVYRELQRLVAEGFVRTAANPPGADPRRAPYEITDAGCASFDAWLAESSVAGIGHSEDDLSARILFVSEADPSLARGLLEQWQEELWIRGKVLDRDREAELMQHRGESAQQLDTRSFLLARRLKHVAADLEFLQEFRIAYEQWTAAPVVRSHLSRIDAGSRSGPATQPMRQRTGGSSGPDGKPGR
jgi:DNA-binding PadR family transcriptional regulator